MRWFDCSLLPVGGVARQEIQQPEVPAKGSSMSTPPDCSQSTMVSAGVSTRLLGHPVLQKLRDLDRLSGFHDQLSDVLFGEEYVRCLTNLEGDDLRWLVDYLDEVRHRNYFRCVYLSEHRLSTASLLSALLPGSVYANSGLYAGPEMCSRRRASFRQTSWFIPDPLPQENSVMYSKEP